jgi:uncharacterized protein with PIN domain
MAVNRKTDVLKMMRKEGEELLSWERCIYCNQLLGKRFSSRFVEEKHYKTCSCENCGKRNWTQVDFFGSGHDSFLEQKIEIESTIRKVREK